MQNLARFRTTSNFGSEYLRSGQSCSKSSNTRSTAFLPAFAEKSPVKFGPVTTEISMWNYTNRIDFFGKHISALRKCCALNFLQTLKNEQVLLAHTPQGTGVFPAIFFYSGARNWRAGSPASGFTLNFVPNFWYLFGFHHYML